MFWAVCGALLMNQQMAHAQLRQSSGPTPVIECLNKAAERYQIAPELLVAMATHESGLNHRAIGPENANGSVDFGLLQINSFWLPTLAKYGIDKQKLFDPCVNAAVGAWILAQNFQRYGVTWEAVGAYNASSPNKRIAYANRIHRTLLKIGKTEQKQAGGPVPVPFGKTQQQASAGMAVYESNEGTAHD